MASLKFDVGLVEDGKVRFMLARGIGIRDAIETQRVQNISASYSGRLIAVVLQAGSHDAPDFTDDEDDSEATAAPQNAADEASRIDFTEEAEKQPPKRNYRVALTHGDATIDILPGFFTEAEAKAEAVRYENVEAVDVVYQLKPLGSNAETEKAGNYAPARKFDGTRYKISDVAYDARAAAFRQAFSKHLEQLGKSIDLIEDACCVGIVAKSLKDLAMDLGDFEDAFLQGLHGSTDAPELIAALGWDD